MDNNIKDDNDHKEWNQKNEDRQEEHANRGIWAGTAVFIVVMAVICVCIILLSPREFGSFSISVGGGEAMLRNTMEVAADESISLEISAHAEGIYFYESDNDRLVIKEYYRSGRHPLADIRQSGNRVTVAGKRYNEFMMFGWFFGDGDRIEVYLPGNQVTEIDAEASSGSIRSRLSFEGSRIALETKSGSISWEGDVKADEITLQASSGSVRAESLTGAVTAKSNSGSISINRVKGAVEAVASSGSVKILGVEGDLRAKSNSGSVSVEQIEGFVTADTSSGSIKILGLTGGAEAGSSSGSVHIEVDEVKDDINAVTSSGGVRIRIPKKSEFIFQADVNSGGIHTDFDDDLRYDERGKNASGTVGENPRYEIRTKASSGSIRVTY